MNNKLTIENEENIKNKKKQHYIPCTMVEDHLERLECRSARCA